MEVQSKGNGRWVSIVLEKFEVLDDHDPLWLGAGEIRFAARVTPGDDETRASVVRLPTCGVYRMRPGTQIIERTIFEGDVGKGEDLRIQITGIEEDFLSPPDDFERYVRRFTGDPLSWAGTYTPDDETDDPESLTDWRLWYRIEVRQAAPGLVGDPNWGPNFNWREMMDMRRGPNGQFDPQLWQKAREHRDRMRLPHPKDDQPGGDAPDNELRAVCYREAQGKKLEIALRAAANPRASRSFGDLGRYVEVAESFEGVAAIKIGVKVEEMNGIDPATAHLFWWDERRSAFRGVARSGLETEGRYVWGKINRPGVYGVFALPSDQARLTTLKLLKTAAPWDGATRELGPAITATICPTILCNADLSELLVNEDLLARFGLEDRLGRDLARYGQMEVDPKGRPIGWRPVERPGPRRWVDVTWSCEECLRSHEGPGGLVGLAELELFGGTFFPPEESRTRARWESIGPTNLGGRVKALAWHPTDPGVVFAGNSQGGVYKSADRGTSWRALWSEELTLAVGALAVAPSDGEVIYAGTGEYGGWYGSGVGMYVSTDGGDDWDLTAGAPSLTRYSKIVVHPTDPAVVYAAGDAGVERTRDGGRIWELILTGAVSDLVMDPTDPDTLYAGCEDARGVQRTTQASAYPFPAGGWAAMNDGLTLMRSHSGFPQNNYIKMDATTEGGGTVLWLLINSLVDPWPGSDPPNIFAYGTTVYRWNGRTWDQKGQLRGTTYVNWCSVIAVEPGSPGVVYAGRVGLDWTPDGGANWYGLGAGHSDQHAIAFDRSDPRRTLLGNDGGIYQWAREVDTEGSPTETTWDYRPANRDHVTIQFLNVAVSESGQFRVGGSTQDQGVLVNRVGGTFDGIGGHEWGPLDIYAQDGRTIMWDPGFAGSAPLQRSDDGGRRRRDASNGLGGRWVNEIAIHPADPDIVLVATPRQEVDGRWVDAAIYRSLDGGAEPPAPGFSQVQTFADRVQDITFSPSDPARVYAVAGNEVWVSRNAGGDWSKLAYGPRPEDLATVSVDWTDLDLIYVTYRLTWGSNVWRGTVDAASVWWRDISGARDSSSLPKVPAHRLIVDRRASERLYVATDIGVFRTLDGGDWWYPFDEGLPNALVNDIAYRPSSQALYVSTFGRGMYERLI